MTIESEKGVNQIFPQLSLKNHTTYAANTPPTPLLLQTKKNLLHNNNQCLGPVQDIGADVKRHPTVKIKQD